MVSSPRSASGEVLLDHALSHIEDQLLGPEDGPEAAEAQIPFPALQKLEVEFTLEGARGGRSSSDGRGSSDPGKARHGCSASV